MTFSIFCNRSEINTVLDVIRPFHLSALPFGFLCFQYRNGKFVATPSSVNVVALLLNFTISIVGLATAMPRQNAQENGSLMLSQGFKFAYACTALSQLVGNIIALRCRHRFVDLLQQLHRIDEQMAVYKVRPDHWLHYRVICVGCLYMVVTMLAIGVGSSWAASTVCARSAWGNTVLGLISAYVALSYCTVLGGYALGLLAIRMRLDALNETIGGREACTDVWTVQRLARICDVLHDCCDQLNGSFALSVVSCVGAAFVTNIVFMFSLYTFMAHALHLPIGELMALSLVWNAHFQFWPLLLAHAGEELATAGRRTGQQIHRQLNAYASDVTAVDNVVWRAVERQLKHFSQQVLHRRPVANARLFLVNWTMVYAVIH